MDAREIIVGTKIDIWGAAGEAAADTILEALTAAGYQIIHRDENHGPTLERVADYCWSKRDLLADAEKKQIAAGLTGRDYYGRRLEAELLSRAIRAMGEKK